MCQYKPYSKALRLKKSSPPSLECTEKYIRSKKEVLPYDGALLEPKKGGKFYDYREIII